MVTLREISPLEKHRDGRVMQQMNKFEWGQTLARNENDTVAFSEPRLAECGKSKTIKAVC